MPQNANNGKPIYGAQAAIGEALAHKLRIRANSWPALPISGRRPTTSSRNPQNLKGAAKSRGSWPCASGRIRFDILSGHKILGQNMAEYSRSSFQTPSRNHVIGAKSVQWAGFPLQNACAQLYRHSGFRRRASIVIAPDCRRVRNYNGPLFLVSMPRCLRHIMGWVASPWEDWFLSR